jgi:hypothetical protein
VKATRSIFALVFAIAFASACGSSSSSSSNDAAPNDANVETNDAPAGCAPSETRADDGHCEPAGVPTTACGKGFVADDVRGCTAVLPSDACGPGKMAALGETTCRDVAPCADGTWGDIPVDATTQYVDASFAGSSDGSSKAPWKTIGAAITAASSGAIVAVAAGSYAEDVIAPKPVRIWGKCPSMVEIVGSATGVAAVLFQVGANASELHGVALRGGSVGVMDAGGRDVIVDRAWVHDTAKPGVELTSDHGVSTLTLSNALVEHATRFSVLSVGAQITVDSSTLRDTQPQAGTQPLGQGIQIVNVGAQRGAGTIRNSILERNHEVGVAIAGSDVTIESSLVRDMMPKVTDGTLGQAILAEIDRVGGQRAVTTVHASVIERALGAGILASGSDLTIDATVVRDTAVAKAGDIDGEGIVAIHYGTSRSTLTMSASVVERSVGIGLSVVGSDATITSSIVRTTSPRADGSAGGGVYFGSEKDERTNATFRSSLVADCYDVGIDLWSSDLVFDAVLVHNIQARASDGLYGDGLVVYSTAYPATATVTASRIEKSARAGVSNFGASLTMGSTTLDCDAIALDGETSSAGSPSFVDDGANACGCSGASSVCQVLSNGLAPPELTDGP